MALARPWWERWPDRFRAHVERLSSIQVAYAHALTEAIRGRSGHPVPSLIAAGDEELEASARVLYLSVRDGQLRLRFQLDTSGAAEESYEVTFVSDPAARPLFSATAVASVENEYRVDAELPQELATTWEALKVTDRMPYRLILRPVVHGR
jgi:hypothetical protein